MRSCETCQAECTNAGTALKISDVCHDYMPPPIDKTPVGDNECVDQEKSCRTCLREFAGTCSEAFTKENCDDWCESIHLCESKEVVHGYESLAKVLEGALDQAAKGKGKERHAEEGQAFEDQLIMVIEKICPSFQLGQAIKKICESQRLPKDMAKTELLGAINYISAKVISLG